MPLKIKQDDQRPWFVAQLQNDDGTGINVTGAVSVEIIVRKRGAETILFRNPCEVLTQELDIPDLDNEGSPVPDLNGWVRYKWAEGDTADPGSYEAEWKITWDNGDLQTVPTEGTYRFKILPDLVPDPAP